MQQSRQILELWELFFLLWGEQFEVNPCYPFFPTQFYLGWDPSPPEQISLWDGIKLYFLVISLQTNFFELSFCCHRY